MVDDIFNKLRECTGFDWDKWNELKNWSKHQVSKQECEEIFFNQPFIVAGDKKH